MFLHEIFSRVKHFLFFFQIRVLCFLIIFELFVQLHLEPVWFYSLSRPPPARPHGPVPTVRSGSYKTQKNEILPGPDFLARAMHGGQVGPLA